jgi:Cytochrome c oxidase subunit IV
MTSSDIDDAHERDTSTRRDAPSVRFEMLLFGVLTAFLVVAGVVYYVWSDEWAGTVLLVLAGGLSAISAGYFYFQGRLERGDVSRAGERGPAPVAEPAAIHASIWPLEMGGGMTITFLGLVLSRLIVLLGLVLMLHAVVGWIAQSRSGH